MATVAPYGSWASPISAASGWRAPAAGGSGAHAGRATGRSGGPRGGPSEGGRTALMRRPDGRRAGGGDAGRRPTRAPGSTSTAAAPGPWPAPDVVVFAEFADQRLYRLRLGEEPVAITPEPEEPARAALRRHAAGAGRRDGRLRARGRTRRAAAKPENQIVALPLERRGRGAGARRAGATSTPSRGSRADGATLAFTCWDHPNMPWDGTELWTAPLGGPEAAEGRGQVAGRPHQESIFQPEWGPDGRLHFVSDRDGLWNLYAVEPRTAAARSS